jgi:hypothetical protein
MNAPPPAGLKPDTTMPRTAPDTAFHPMKHDSTR